MKGDSVGIEIPAIQARLARFLGTAESDPVKRQETQIVQSQLDLRDFLPGFTSRLDRLPYLYQPGIALTPECHGNVPGAGHICSPSPMASAICSSNGITPCEMASAICSSSNPSDSFSPAI